MPRRRERAKSAILITMGTLCIVGGLLGLVCGFCGMAGMAFTMSLGGAGPMMRLEDYMDEQAPAWKVVEVIKPIGLTILSILFLIAGAGLFMRQRWARVLAVFAACCLILLNTLHMTYEIGAVYPAMQEFERGPGAGTLPAGQTESTMIGVVIGGVFWLLIGIGLVLGLLNGPASAALSPYAVAPRDFEEEEDEEREEQARLRRRPTIDEVY